MSDGQRRITVVGAGMLGVNIALAAVKAGHQVSIIEEHAAAGVGASINLGAIRLCGKRPGRELDMAVASRSMWDAIAADIPKIKLQPSGSLTLLRSREEIAHAEQYAASVHDQLDLTMLVGGEITTAEPTLAGTFPAALYCRDDAAIEPGRAADAILDYLWLQAGVDIQLNTTVVDIQPGPQAIHLATDAGAITADQVFVCTGAAALEYPAVAEAGLSVTNLHAMIGRIGAPINALIGDIHSLPDAQTLATTNGSGGGPVPWTVAPSPLGSLVVGIVHEAHDGTLDAPTETIAWLQRTITQAFALRNGSTPARKVSVAALDASPDPYAAIEIHPNVTVVTGAGRHGTTLGPAIAQEVIEALG